MKQPIKMTPGDDLHLSLLMAPHNLNLAVGQFRDQLLGYGRAAFEAGKAGQCLHQIQEPAPATAMDALREAEAALEVAMARILKADPAHSICVTSEAKALVAVRAALAAPAPMLVAQPQLHAALFAARGALQHMKEGGKPTQSLLNEAIAAIDSVVVTQAAPAAVAVPDEREALNRLEAACDMRAQLTTPEAYKAIAECKGMIDALEELDEARRQARAALAATPAAVKQSLTTDAALPGPDAAIIDIMRMVASFGETARKNKAIELREAELFHAIETKLRALLATGGQAQANSVIDFPHEEVDALAITRYKVVDADKSMFWESAVVAGDGTRQLYTGRKVECENMARKFAGAFAEGAFVFHAMNAPQAQAEHIKALIEVSRMPNQEHVADAHNAAVRHLRAIAAAKGEQK